MTDFLEVSLVHGDRSCSNRARKKVTKSALDGYGLLGMGMDCSWKPEAVECRPSLD